MAERAAHLVRCAGRAIGVAITPAAARHTDPAHSGRGDPCAPGGDRSAANELVMGGADAAEFWLRRHDVPAVRKSAGARRAHRRPKGDSALLGHLGLPTTVPAVRSARPPPLPLGRSDQWYDPDVSHAVQTGNPRCAGGRAGRITDLQLTERPFIVPIVPDDSPHFKSALNFDILFGA
jgi:hypothetical protein